MIIKNKTNGKIISEKAKFANSLIDKTLGLLRKSNPKTLIFKTRFGIHTFFLKDPIDILILNKNLKVVTLKQNLKPNNLFFWNPKYQIVIELPQKTISNSSINLSCQLSFE